MTLLDALQQPAMLVPSVFVLGLLVGSFVNVVILRLPVMLERDWQQQASEILGQPQENAPRERFDLIHPGSRCPGCQRPIRPWENIPVISWLALRGRCRGCGQRISARYPLVELITGLLSASVASHFGWGPELAAALILTWTLVALSGIDIDHQLLPDNITLPLLWLGLGISLAGLFTGIEDAVIGAMAGYLSLWLVFHVFRLVTGKEGMGYGDFKLLALLGAWLGWQALPVIILLSSLVGAVAGIAMIALLGRDRQLPIPFGPYLAAAGWLTLLWRDDIIAGYLRWSGLG
ncbi:prepilin peptidase [Aquisalimonas sp. 2447]|uniref:prepilin peptidase n=1 Tax=Aquisalimonas sp. 2447 TaxID=2740807 RepID=UPI0014326956|nr:A24 family peptidase [Aquisalimonas sp. 2447]QIT56265.1 prepilin peptidase [Aquisalimonas sp. 2447]